MSKHTPGPWVQREGEVWAKSYGLISRSYYGSPDGEGAANARLIAAAPELLEALIDTLDALECWTGSDVRIGQARAAISKATGGNDAK